MLTVRSVLLELDFERHKQSSRKACVNLRNQVTGTKIIHTVSPIENDEIIAKNADKCCREALQLDLKDIDAK